MNKGDDPYQLLGLKGCGCSDDGGNSNPSSSSSTVTASDIKKAYRKLALQYHPDKGGDSTIFAKISNAYEILSNEEQRTSYDLSQKYHPGSGYDPNGPTYSTSGGGGGGGGDWNDCGNNRHYPPSMGRNNSKTSSTSFPSYYTNDCPPQRSGRTSSTTTTTSTKTSFSSSTDTNGNTTVNVNTPTSSFTFSVPSTTTHSGGCGGGNEKYTFQDPFELFKEHFGEEAAKEFFAAENNGPTTMKSPMSRTPKSISKKMSSTTMSSPMNNKNDTIKTKKKNKSCSTPSKKPSAAVSRTNTCSKAGDIPSVGVKSMSTSQKTVTNSNGQQELIITTTIEKFDGTTETKVERKTISDAGGTIMMNGHERDDYNGVDSFDFDDLRRTMDGNGLMMMTSPSSTFGMPQTRIRMMNNMKSPNSNSSRRSNGMVSPTITMTENHSPMKISTTTMSRTIKSPLLTNSTTTTSRGTIQN